MSPRAQFDPRLGADPANADALRADQRVVLVMDAGGTSLRFNAVQGGRALLEPHTAPSFGDDLDRSLREITEGFAAIHQATGRRAVAISLAFPGPADYRRGVIGDPPNLARFRGGVPLGPMLAQAFGLPTFVNNDGALFAYGEALGGLLPFVNDRLAAAGAMHRFRNLLGFTFGTGFGGGIVVDGRLVIGDNSAAGQIWMVRHRDDRQRVAEEGVSIRAVRRAYAAALGLALDDAPEPKQIALIATGEAPGDRRAASEAFHRLGQAAGDAIAHAMALIDGLVVLGGGLSGAAGLFRAALLEELNGRLDTSSGPVARLPCKVVDLDDPAGLSMLVAQDCRELAIPGTDRTIGYAPQKLTGVGVTRLGTTAAIELGAYACALGEIAGT